MNNIVMICIDCLRNDHIKSNYSDTPFLDSLAEDGTYFNNLYSTATTTTPCVASYMTGRYSENNGIASLKNAHLKEDIETIASISKENNYQTLAEITGPIIKQTGLDKGFEEYNDHVKEDFSEWKNEALERINDLDSPFYTYLHIWDIHADIKVSPEYDKPKYGDNAYSRKLSELDRELEDFYEKLPNNTTIVLLGDHGESIAYQDKRGKTRMKQLRTLMRYKLGLNTRPLERAFNQLAEYFYENKIKDHYIENGHGENIFDFTSNVPLIINGPDAEPATIDEQVRQIDIFPTVLDLMNLETPSNIDADSLLPIENLNERVAYIRGCGTSLKSEKNWIEGVRSGDWKYFEYPNRSWSSELYNLKKDPKELRNIKNKEKKQELKKKLPFRN